jgi:hypothetical protein
MMAPRAAVNRAHAAERPVRTGRITRSKKGEPVKGGNDPFRPVVLSVIFV